MYVVVELKSTFLGDWMDQPLGEVYGPYKERERAEVMRDHMDNYGYRRDYIVIKLSSFVQPKNMSELMKKKLSDLAKPEH